MALKTHGKTVFSPLAEKAVGFTFGKLFKVIGPAVGIVSFLFFYNIAVLIGIISSEFNLICFAVIVFMAFLSMLVCFLNAVQYRSWMMLISGLLIPGTAPLIAEVQLAAVHAYTIAVSPCGIQSGDHFKVCLARHTVYGDLLIISDPSREIIRPFHERSSIWKESIKDFPDASSLNECSQNVHHMYENLYQVYMSCGA